MSTPFIVDGKAPPDDVSVTFETSALVSIVELWLVVATPA
jgi:hypothetical protein